MRQIRFITCLFFFTAAAGVLPGMSLETVTTTNAPIKFVETYKVGMVLFENRTGDTNLDYLRLSLPLMIKEGVKKNIDYFIPPEELLPAKAKFGEDFPDRNIRYRSTDTVPRSLGPDGKPFSRPSLDRDMNDARKKASLRRSLDFTATVIRKNQNSFREIAVKQTLHYLLYGEYDRVKGNRIRVRVYLYSAISGMTRHSAEHVFPEGRVLLDLDRLIDRFRKHLITFPTVQLRVVTEPAGALVYIGSAYMGTSPLVLPYMTATNHRILIRKTGYAPIKLDISLRPGKRYLLQKKLNHTGGEGMVSITSTPPGADVRIDLIQRGKTPLVLSNFPVGTYRVSVDMDKYHRQYLQLVVNKGKKSDLKFKLKPVVKGELSIDDRVKRYRRRMNIFFWSGGGSLLTYAFFYFKREDYLHQYQQAYLNSDFATAASAYDKYDNYRTAAKVSLGVTAGCFAVSAYFLIRYMIADDRKLGKAPETGTLPDVFAASAPGRFSINWRF